MRAMEEPLRVGAERSTQQFALESILSNTNECILF